MGDITMDIGKKVTGAFQRRTKTKKENNVGDLTMSDSSLDFHTEDEIFEFDPEIGEKKPCANRADIRFVRYCENIVEAAWFNNVMTFTIVLNVIVLIAEVIYSDNESGSLQLDKQPLKVSSVTFLNLFDMDERDVIKSIKAMVIPSTFLVFMVFVLQWACDTVFLAIYTVEFILKFYVEPLGYWTKWSNLLDFVILAITFVQMMLSRKGASSSTVNSVKVVRATVNVKVIKILRALRALRTVKAIWLVAGARFILTSILQAQIKSLTQVGIIILLFLAIASILTFTTIFEPIGDTGSVSEAIANNWGCFIACFSSLFMIITVDGWYELIGIIARALIAICIIFGHFMIFNLFIAINVLQVDEAQRDYHDDLLAEREALLQAKKEKILQRQNDDMKKLRDEQDARGCSFSEMVNNFKSTLKNDDYTLTENVITDIDWIENHRFCLDKLDDQTYRLQQLIFEYTNCLIYTQNEELRKRLGS